MATDLETMKAMLEQARIPYRTEEASESIGLSITSLGAVDEQPFPGGYGLFISELVFTREGALRSVWAWE